MLREGEREGDGTLSTPGTGMPQPRMAGEGVVGLGGDPEPLPVL